MGWHPLGREVGGGRWAAGQGGARSANGGGLTQSEEEEHPGGPHGPSWAGCRTVTD
jgi:hypothetical protein